MLSKTNEEWKRICINSLSLTQSRIAFTLYQNHNNNKQISNNFTPMLKWNEIKWICFESNQLSTNNEDDNYKELSIRVYIISYKNLYILLKS